LTLVLNVNALRQPLPRLLFAGYWCCEEVLDNISSSCRFLHMNMVWTL